MKIFNGMMLEIKKRSVNTLNGYLSWTMIYIIHDYILKRNASKKGWQEEDGSTMESSKVDNKLKNLLILMICLESPTLQYDNALFVILA